MKSSENEALRNWIVLNKIENRHRQNEDVIRRGEICEYH